MQIIKAKRAFVLAMVLFLFISGFTGLMGCVDSTPTVKSPLLQGDGFSFSGDLLQKVLDGLLDGASGEIGGNVMGLILNLLGWGGGGGDDQKYLTAMSQKLDQIVSMLNDIENSLDALMKQLKITEEEILANTNDPTNAITQINSSHQELQGLSTNKAGSVDQETLANFTNRAENVYNIYSLINAIHDAIIPPTIAKSPVLNNFADLSLNKGNSITDSYLGLEQYFSQLLYYQMEGINIIVETKTYRAKAGLPQIDGRDASAYMNFFTSSILQPEVDNFMDNVYRMILSQANLIDGSGFLPSEAEDILSRANFFRIKALNEDHFGLRATLIATNQQDLSEYDSFCFATTTNIWEPARQTYHAQGISSFVASKTYDYWEGGIVKGRADYTIITYDFGDVPESEYYTCDGGWPVHVQKFKDDYTVPSDGSGTINYGHYTFGKNVPARTGFDSNADWVAGTSHTKNVSASGGANVRWIELSGSDNRKSNYNGDYELTASFVASTSNPFTVHYSVQANGCTHANVTSATGDVTSYIYYRTGLWDATTGHVVNQFKTNHVTASCSNYQDSHSCHDTKCIGDNIHGSFYFPDPSQGHTYYVYFHVHVDGGSDASGTRSSNGNMKLDGISGNIYITF
ncbi:MAG: hypothetical protein AVO38_10200 [delta proteobacterium ML8_D]|nr:MAG: hypothetical protein AVO38_10200 [delta proteobacterium ML8_D]